MFKLDLELNGIDDSATNLTRRIKAKAERGLEILWHELYKEVQINLSNNILNIRTGNLIGSLEYTSYIQALNTVITAQVGVDTVYARYQEFGFRGTRNMGSYTQTVNYAGRPYIRPAFDQIALNIGAVLQTAMNGTNV